MKRYVGLIKLIMALLVVFVWQIAFVPVSAQGGKALFLEAPAMTLGNGDDFATTVLGDPWDMDKRRDIGWEENLDDITVQNGIWSGTIRMMNPVAGTGGYVFPLFQGFYTAWPVGNIGANYPVDSSRYTQLSYRLYVSERHAPHAVYWTHEVNWPDGSNYFAFFDSAQGWNVYNYDLTQTNGDPGAQSGSWQAGPVRGLRIDPNVLASEGTQVRFDWIRLTDPSTSPVYTLNWAETGFEYNETVQVMLDSDNQGYDGSIIAEVPASAGSYDFLTCILPGGEYYFYLRSGDVVSNYGEKLTINNPPVLQWDASTMGQDYASVELGNPWDMNDKTDLENLQDIFFSDPEYYRLQQFYDWQFQGGVFSATADSEYAITHYDGLQERMSDVQLWMNVDPDNPIDASVYRYLVVKMKIDDFTDRSLHERVKDGWVARIIWWDEGLQQDGFSTDEIVLYEGWNIYVIDLMAREAPVGYDPFPAQIPWSRTGVVKHLRIDPLEVSQDTRFHIDEVRLLTGPQANSHLRLNLAVADWDGQQVVLTYYYDSDNQGFDGTPIPDGASDISATGTSAAAGEHSVFVPMVSIVPGRIVRPLDPLLDEAGMEMVVADVDTSTMPAGRYYIYACASDGIEQTCRYLPMPVTVAH